VWLIILSDQLPIVALVGHYPTNKLMVRGPIYGGSFHEEATFKRTEVRKTVSGISQPFGWLFQIQG
jgi:hypothetical protein